MRPFQVAAAALGVLSVCAGWAQQPTDVQHVVVAREEGKFHGWPANNGIWQWENEILVGYTQGEFFVKDSHNIRGIEQSHFARSLDGGQTWTTFDPESFLDGPDEKWKPVGKTMLAEAIDFSHRGFAMRVFATGYHGNDDPEAGFYYSYDRGATWKGPHFLGKVAALEEFRDKQMTPRTDYLVMGPTECFVFVMASDKEPGRGSRTAVIHTKDGGLSFQFVSWVSPDTQVYRSIMPNTVQLDEDRFLMTLRRINRRGGTVSGLVEAYISEDRCRSWYYYSTVKEIRSHSNPPAVVKLQDGRICCVYGDRDTATINGKYSGDDGLTWGEEFLIRDGYESDDWADLGYPRLVQRPDGKMVAVYYYADGGRPEPYIAASIWTP